MADTKTFKVVVKQTTYCTFTAEAETEDEALAALYDPNTEIETETDTDEILSIEEAK